MKKVFLYDRVQYFRYREILTKDKRIISFSWLLSDTSERVKQLDGSVCVDLSSFIPFINNNADKLISFEPLLANLNDSILFICDKQYEEDLRYVLRYVFDSFEDVQIESTDSVTNDCVPSYRRVKRIVDLSEQEIDVFLQAFNAKLYGHSLFKKEFKQLIDSFRVFNMLGEHKVLSLFLMGDSGVGKTEVARAIHKALGGQTKLAKINFGNYSSHDALNSLIGSPRGYIGSENGELIKRLNDSVVGLILIDEFEKADIPVFNYFLDVLENGKVTDSQGDEYDVDGYIIVFTSNMSLSEYQIKISPELKSRFDYKGLFNLLTEEDKTKYMHYRVNQILDSYKSKVGKELPNGIHDMITSSIDVSDYRNMRDLNKVIKDVFVDIINNMNDVLLEQAYNKINNDSQPGYKRKS